MKRVFLFLVAILVSAAVLGQVPQGFNYQAVARNADGEILSDETMTVRIGILNNNELVWQEDHSASTNSHGQFSLIIGDDDASKTGGSAGDFNSIPWGNGTFELNVSIDNGSGFEDMGNSPLMSVPFALYSQNSSSQNWSVNNDTIFTNSSVGIGTNAPNQSLLAIQSSNPQGEKPLFEVRNDLGNPVFAVYNDSVRVYVDEDKKGAKGGFAVGGYNAASKGVTQDYLRITPDSVRIYVPELPSGNKRGKGGFAIGGYNASSKATPKNLLEISSTSTNIYFDTTGLDKGVKGGFAIGGYNSSTKAGETMMMSLTPRNYLIGEDAGLNLTTGKNNSFLGYEAGMNTTEGNNNIFLGKRSGHLATTAENNIFLGNGSGFNTISGKDNVFIGNQAGLMNTDGNYNSYVGYQSGRGSNSFYNTFFGYRSGYHNTSGKNNIAIGFEAGYGAPLSGDGLTGQSNVFLGYQSGYKTTTGKNNIFLGSWSGFNNTVGESNIFLGNGSGNNNTTASDNVFIGNLAGHENTIGQRNVFIGETAGYSNLSGSYNTIMGYQAGYGQTGGDGDFNTILGYQAGRDIRNGYKNVLIGYQAGYKIRDNRYNIIIGEGAGYNLEGTLDDEFSGQANLLLGLYAGSALSTGSANIFMGLDAGYNCDPAAVDNIWIGLGAGRSSASSGSVFIGKYAGYNEDNDNKLIINTGYTGTDNLNNALVYGDFSTNYFRHNGYVAINHSGNSAWGLTIGTDDPSTDFGLVVYGKAYSSSGTWSSSDARLKRNIETYRGALSKITNLRGVSFDWRSNEYSDKGYDNTKQIGVIAQEVEEYIPEVVSEGPEGYKSVDYSKLTAVLIEAVKEQQKQIEDLERRIAELEQ